MTDTINPEALGEMRSAGRSQEAASREEDTVREPADRCPACDADFDGGPIPEEHRHHYSPPYRFSRRIGVVWNDRVQVWRCPDCNHEWPRGR